MLVSRLLVEILILSMWLIVNDGWIVLCVCWSIVLHTYLDGMYNHDELKRRNSSNIRDRWCYVLIIAPVNMSSISSLSSLKSITQELQQLLRKMTKRWYVIISRMQAVWSFHEFGTISSLSDDYILSLWSAKGSKSADELAAWSGKESQFSCAHCYLNTIPALIWTCRFRF